MFEGFNAQLPLIDPDHRRASATGFGLTGIYMAVGIVVIGFSGAELGDFRGRAGASGKDCMLRVPVIGPLSSQFAMARFCRMLGTLLNAGVPLVQALNVARNSIGNQILVDAVSNSIERVKEGAQLGASLSDCRNLFPGSVLEMISVGEESGKLDAELVRIAVVTEADLDRNLKTAVALAGAGHAFFHRRVYRDDFHRHAPSHFQFAGIHQITNQRSLYEYKKHPSKTGRSNSCAPARLHPGGTVAGLDHSGHSGRHRPAQVQPGSAKRPEVSAAKTDIASFKTALSMFEMDMGDYPDGRDGLQALVTKPSGAGSKWRKYLDTDKLPNDPWEHPYVYEKPGKHNPDRLRYVFPGAGRQRRQ